MNGIARLRARIWRITRWVTFVGSALIVALAIAVLCTPLPEALRQDTNRHAGDSVRVLDREGRLLREVRRDDTARQVWATRAELADLPLRALVAAEDRRFFDHLGVDCVSIARAAWQNLRSRRVVSGASTITMQLARLVEPHPRTFTGKLQEAVLALRIEASLDKESILVEYANRAPFGPGIRGLRAASLAYFGKEPAALGAGESAFLAALPKGPRVYDPHKNPARVAARRALVLERMRAFGLLDQPAYAAALAEPTEALPRVGASTAPHFVQAVLAGRAGDSASVGAATVVNTTLDRELQREVEQAVAVQVRALAERHVSAGAALVVDHATGEILAYVGSPDPFDTERGGYNDGVRAHRQAGSTLKPLLYGAAFDRKEIDAASWLADVPVTLPLANGAFVPQNYDGKFHGPTRARVALGSSLNVPAVTLSERVGVGELLTTLRTAGFVLEESPEHYGTALALGDGEVTLLELVRAYAAIARGGAPIAVHGVRAPAPTTDGPASTVMSAQAAWLIGDILADKAARLPAFGERSVLELPFRASVKTGTSKGFRDNWAVGFTDRVTAGVWVGNFDGSNMVDVSGIAGAGPILRSVLIAAQARAKEPAQASVSPESLGLQQVAVCPLSGEAVGPDCPHAVMEWLPAERAAHRHACTMHTHALVDRHSGQLASPRAASATVERRTFLDFPPELASWARASGLTNVLVDQPAAPKSVSSVEQTEGRLRIEHPAPEARYFLEHDRSARSQSVGVRIAAPREATEISLQVDGREVARGARGDVLTWTPSPGRHALVAIAAHIGASSPVFVDVE